MNKKLLLIPLFFVLLVSFVSAVTSPTTQRYFETGNAGYGTTTIIDASNVTNGTLSGVGAWSRVIPNYTIFNPVNSSINSTLGTIDTGRQAIAMDSSVSFWMRPNQTLTYGVTASQWEIIGDGYGLIEWYGVDKRLITAFGSQTHCSASFTANTWYHIFIDIGTGANETNIYVDNVICGSNTASFQDYTSSNVFVGYRPSTIGYGLITDVKFFDSRQDNATLRQKLLDGNFWGGSEINYLISPSEEYASPVAENSTNSFNLTIEWSGYNFSSSIVKFFYNNTEYTPFLIDSDYSSFVNYSINLTTPFIEFNNTPLSFYWEYNLTGSDSNISNTSLFSQYLIYDFPRLNITARNIFSNTTLSNLSGYSDKLKLTNFNTSSSNYLLKLLEGTGDYDLYVIADNYGTDNITNYKTFVLNDTNITIHDITFFLYTNNSINLNIYDIITSGLINSSSSVSLTSENATYNYITDNGTLYADYLNDGIYNIVVDNALYSLYSSFVTVADSSHQIVNAYLSTETNAVKFITQDTLGTAISNVSVVIYYTINGSPTVIASGYTDIFGQFQANLRADLTYYIIASHIDFDTFSGNMQPIDTSYTIIMTEAGSSYTSVFSDINFITQLVASSDNDNATLKYVINSGSGGLSYWGLNFSYINTTWLAVPHKTVFVSFNSTSVAGGNYYYNITNIIGSGLDNFSVLFWFKPVSGDVVIWNETYYVNNLNISDFTLTGGLFDDLEALDNNNALKGLFGALIIILGVIIFGLSKNMTISVVGGLVGVAINFMFGLLPSNLLIVSAIVGLILLIADNIRGIR